MTHIFGSDQCLNDIKEIFLNCRIFEDQFNQFLEELDTFTYAKKQKKKKTTRKMGENKKKKLLKELRGCLGKMEPI